MATDAQIQANRKNAARSTGPKTEKGKAKARQNALKHGGRAKTLDIMPVLPQEDPKVLEERIQTWLDEWQPRNAIESGLVRRGEKLSWLVDMNDKELAQNLWTLCRAHRPVRDPGHNRYGVWREHGPRPADRPAALALLRGVINERIERLEEMVAEHEEIAEIEASERADRAAFDPSPAFDRFQRRQAALGRVLLRTVDTLRRLKKEDCRTQPVVEPDDPSWDKIPILSLSSEHNQEDDRNGILSHEGDPKDSE